MSERFDANPNNLDVGADLPHTSRYMLARGFLRPGEVVVDGACGPGYGSKLISQIASKVISLDYADVFSSKWLDPKIEFKLFDFEKEPEYPECDAWISLESIEHLYDPQSFLDKVTKATKRLMVFSSDNHESVGLNEFHHSNVLLPNMRHFMNKYPEWQEYNSFYQGSERGQWLLVYVRKGSVML
jgi:2-polyprenyl-3-methyl-5-hydroxy-6-metoxy-1,4-benzoquinol methylase